jgi:hypothetical protein
MIFAAIVWGKRINVQSISNHGFTPSLLKLTARQYSKETLPGKAIRPSSRFFSQELVPVASRVWRGICKVACGWFRDRGIMMKGIR